MNMQSRQGLDLLVQIPNYSFPLHKSPLSSPLPLNDLLFWDSFSAITLTWQSSLAQHGNCAKKWHNKLVIVPLF